MRESLALMSRATMEELGGVRGGVRGGGGEQ